MFPSYSLGSHRGSGGSVRDSEASGLGFAPRHGLRSSEGCLEACLPDISYQRHIARGTTLRPSFVMGRALRPLVNPNPPRLSHAVQELLHSLKTSPDYQQHKKKLSMSNRRSLSLENLALT
ncbi:hypothetical protein SK128_011022 [Halocaridina rubra]|uniref:Uncharacterized protein n=1 Tax=Halocaridina rubra TaxID=373956 RepID=A0AAN8XQE4_HALRR